MTKHDDKIVRTSGIVNYGTKVFVVRAEVMAYDVQTLEAVEMTPEEKRLVTVSITVPGNEQKLTPEST